MAEGLTLIKSWQLVCIYIPLKHPQATSTDLFLKPRCLDKIYKTDDSNSQKLIDGDILLVIKRISRHYPDFCWTYPIKSNQGKRQNNPILESGDVIYMWRTPIYRSPQCFRAYLDQTNSFPTRVVPHNLRVVPKTRVEAHGGAEEEEKDKVDDPNGPWKGQSCSVHGIHRKGSGIPKLGPEKRRQKLMTTV